MYLLFIYVCIHVSTRDCAGVCVCARAAVHACVCVHEYVRVLSFKLLNLHFCVLHVPVHV